MIKNILFVVLLIFSVLACEKPQNEAYPADTPDCIVELIDQERQLTEGKCQLLKSVKRYQFQSTNVYLFEVDPNCIVDGLSTVYAENCDVLCQLGGIAGFKVCGGELFFENATLEETIWTK